MSVTELPTPSGDKLLLAALSRVEALVKSGMRVVVNTGSRTSIYSGTIDRGLIEPVMKIMSAAVEAKSVKLDQSLPRISNVDSLLEPDASVSAETRISYIDLEDQSVLTVQQFKFGKSTIFGFIVSIRRKQTR
jgi:hypothetical protein